MDTDRDSAPTWGGAAPTWVFLVLGIWVRVDRSLGGTLAGRTASSFWDLGWDWWRGWMNSVCLFSFCFPFYSCLESGAVGRHWHCLGQVQELDEGRGWRPEPGPRRGQEWRGGKWDGVGSVRRAHVWIVTTAPKWGSWVTGRLTPLDLLLMPCF